jgi:predicted glutamine amidotransferase
MCRFTFYLGEPIRLSALITEPAHSLINQSFAAREREEPLNGDGFGVAWYVPDVAGEPGRFRAVTPAWNNANLHEIARVVTSPCVLAHVRAATQQLVVSELNCHPFTAERFSFMHNGDIGGFSRVRRKLLAQLSDARFAQIQGSTDSEHFFALLLDELDCEAECPDVEAMARAFQRSIERVAALVAEFAPAEFIYINAVLTDGSAAVACRYTTDAPSDGSSLYLNQGQRYVCEDGVCRMLDTIQDGSVIVSSEPLSVDPGWSAFAANSMCLLADNRLRRSVSL